MCTSKQNAVCLKRQADCKPLGLALFPYVLYNGSTQPYHGCTCDIRNLQMDLPPTGQVKKHVKELGKNGVWGSSETHDKR